MFWVTEATFSSRYAFGTAKAVLGHRFAPYTIISCIWGLPPLFCPFKLLSKKKKKAVFIKIREGVRICLSSGCQYLVTLFQSSFSSLKMRCNTSLFVSCGLSVAPSCGHRSCSWIRRECSAISVQGNSDLPQADTGSSPWGRDCPNTLGFTSLSVCSQRCCMKRTQRLQILYYCSSYNTNNTDCY